MKNSYHCSLIILVALLLMAGTAFAFRNVCPVCKTVNDVELVFCGECHRAMNQCLDCGQLNPMKADVCASCSANLAEMRSLGKIDQKTREDLRLGMTERSQLLRQLGRIENKLRLKPENAEALMFRKAEIFLTLENWGRAINSHYEFQRAFPASTLIEQSNVSLSHALCKMGWMRYESGKTKQALEQFEEATVADPKSGNAWRLVGQMHLALDEPKEATVAYQKALALDPKDTVAKSALHMIKRAARPAAAPASKKTPKKKKKTAGKK